MLFGIIESIGESGRVCILEHRPIECEYAKGPTFTLSANDQQGLSDLLTKARRDPSFDATMTLDLDYIENWTLRMDIGILLKTIPSVLRAEGK